MQNFTKGLVQITDLFNHPLSLYNGLWGGGWFQEIFWTPPPPHNP